MKRFTGRFVLVVLVCGLAAAIALRFAYPRAFGSSDLQVIAVLLLAACVALVRPLRCVLSRAIERLDATGETPRGRAVVAAVCGLATFTYLLATAVVHARDLSPRLHDEFSYLIQAQLLARGRLWLPAFPDGIGDFFESFHILVEPVYASIYFPGTALLYVPGVWFGAPHWISALLTCGAVAATTYLVARPLVGGALAVLAAIFLVTTPQFRMISPSVMSHQPAMLAGLLIVAAWLRWRATKSFTAGALLGASLGWAAIVRPYDVLAYAVPVGIAFLFDLRGMPARRIAATATVMIAFALPFGTLQFLLNHATTGDVFTTPYRAYIDAFQPGSTLGFPPLPTERPRTKLQQKHDLYDRFAREQLEAHRPHKILTVLRNRLPKLGPATMPSAWLLVVLPLGFFGALRDRRVAVLAAAPILWVALYALNPYFTDYYPVVVAPAMAVTLAFGIRLIVTSRPQDGPRVFAIVAAGAVALSALPEARMDFSRDRSIYADVFGVIDAQIATEVTAPAVVLFRYHAGPMFHVEPVYNRGVANPLDAFVIRAHDLGPERDLELAHYFAQREPDRVFWLYDRSALTLRRLGRAEELVQRKQIFP